MGRVHTPAPTHWVGAPKPGPDDGGEPPYDGGMEARVAKLEAILPTLSTREDVLRLEAKMHQELHALTWKLIGSMLTFGTLLSAAVFFIAKNVQ